MFFLSKTYVTYQQVAPGYFAKTDSDGYTYFSEVQVTLFVVVSLLILVLVLFLILNFKNQKRKLTLNNIETKTPKLKQNTLKPEQFLEIHPTPTCICELNGTIKYANVSFGKVIGETPGKLAKRSLFSFLPSYLIEILTFDFSNIQKGRASGSTSQSFLSPVNKTKYQIRWQLLPTTFFPEKELLITFEKVPETEIVNHTLDEPKNIVRQILDNSPVAIFIEDYNGIILEANNSACKLQQFSRDELIGRPVTDLYPMNYHTEIIERQKKMAIYETFSFKSISYTKSGKSVPVEVFVNKTDFFGTPALFFIVHDLTDYIETKKQLDEYKIKADESDRLKSSFLANLSHEVRTPMNSIMGFAELLAEPSIEVDERKVFITFIRQSGKELLAQINSMIDFSKIESGLINLKVELCNFDVLFSNLKEFGNSNPKLSKDVRLFFDLPNNLINSSIASDFSRLQQILEVLLDNSIKYTKNGVIEVGVKNKGPQLFEFFVRDTGIGIPEEKHSQIFEKFRQGNDGNSREFSGMGLGLSIASRLIQFLGGHQWVASEPGKGSEFRFVLPDMLQPVDSPFIQVSCGPITVINKIIVVSPTESIYHDLTHNSKPINYQVFWAQNAQEMKHMMLSNKFLYALIAFDQLPFWQELLLQIKKDEGSQIIGIAEKLDKKRKERLISMGFDDAIQSPSNISILISLLEKKDISPLQLLTININQN